MTYSLTPDGKRVAIIVDRIIGIGRSRLDQAPTGYLYWRHTTASRNQTESNGIQDVLRYKWSQSVLDVLSGESGRLHFNEIK